MATMHRTFAAGSHFVTNLLPVGPTITLPDDDVRLSADPGDWLDDTDRALLHDAFQQSEGDVEAGRLVNAEDLLRELRGS
jgi:hypothetical protein